MKKEGVPMYYIALLQAYQQAEEADNWFSADYCQALQVLIVKEYKLNYQKEGGDCSMRSY